MSVKLTKRQFRTEVMKCVFLNEFYDGDELIGQTKNLYDKSIYADEINISDDEIDNIIHKSQNIYNNIDKVDTIISNNLDKWNISRIGKVELAILRVAVYEYIYDKLDAAIVINEAVDIAKIYSTDKAPSFINGVLAKVVKNNE